MKYSLQAMATVAAPGGPQRPAFDAQLAASGDVVLVELPAGHPRLSRVQPGSGPCYVLDAREAAQDVVRNGDGELIYRTLAPVPAARG